MKRPGKRVRQCALLFFCLGSVFSLSAGIALSQEITIISFEVGECKLSVEADDKWHTLRLRAFDPSYKGCRIDRESMVTILEAAFAKTQPPKLEGTYSSLSIGRLIDYPWLSRYLASAAYGDRGWNARKGKPASGDINGYVAKLLFKKELTEQLEKAFAKGGYSIAGVSVEKVLVGSFRNVPFYTGKISPGRVPFDAQVWFMLKKID